MSPAVSGRAWGLYALMAVLWGIPYLFIKEAVESVELGEDQEKKTAMEFLEGIINDSKVDHVTRVSEHCAIWSADVTGDHDTGVNFSGSRFGRSG